MPEVLADLAAAAAREVKWPQVPWGFLLALVSLSVIFLLYARRNDVFQAFGFNRQEISVLCIGSLAGWIVNVPTFIPLGESTLTVNLGGALIPVFLVAWWWQKGKLPVWKALVGIALVAWVTHQPFVTTVVPGKGVLSQFPYFFLPSVVALLYALVVCVRNPLQGVPVAYAAGSIGALIGADVMHFPAIQKAFGNSAATDVLSFGGAGVFDMVFLAGSMAMALNLVVVVLLTRTPVPSSAPAYPGRPLEVLDSRRAWAAYRELKDPSPMERAAAAIALSNLALQDGDFERSVRMSCLAVDHLLQPGGAPGRARLLLTSDPGLREDLALLVEARKAAAAGRATRVLAGDANVTAKLIVGTLRPQLEQRVRLEEVVA